MAENNQSVLDEETYRRMLQETQGGAGAAGAPVYDDSYRKQQEDVYKQITGRGPFSYDPKNDPLYGVMRDRYVQQGRMAMKDTMGQAAALTGGYGSSYGQAVGQQQYDASLQGLADVIPELYGQAYARWQDEGDRLAQRYQMLGDKARTEYERYRDAYGDWQYERALQDQKEKDAYDREQDAWARQRQEDQTAYSQQQDAYSRLYALIGATGYNPSDEELAAAGMSREAANAILAAYQRQQEPTDANNGKGGSGGGNPNANPNPNPNPKPDPNPNPDGEWDPYDLDHDGVVTVGEMVQGMRNDGSSDQDIIKFILSQGLNPADFGYRTGNAGGGSSIIPVGRQTQKGD